MNIQDLQLGVFNMVVG
jgi:hypothetical protein